MEEERTSTERQQQFLAQDRRERRRNGIVFLILGFCLLPVGIAAAIWLLPQLWGKLGSFDGIVTMIGFLGIGPLLLFHGWTLYQEGLRPISQTEIAHYRRRERTALFRQAQGKLPWYYSRIALIAFALFGCLLLFGSIFTLTNGLQSPRLDHTAVLIAGATYAGAGVALLVWALIISPYRRKRLPQVSASLLERNLVAGEVTGNSAKEDEDE